MGSQEMTMAIEKLAVYIGNLFFLTSDTAAPIVKDVDLSDNIASNHLLYVLFTCKFTFEELRFQCFRIH